MPWPVAYATGDRCYQAGLKPRSLPEFFQFGQLAIPRQRLAFTVLQLFSRRQGKRLPLQHPGAVTLVVFPEYRPTAALCVIGQEIPVAVPTRQVYRCMAPDLGGAGGRRPAGLHIGVVGGWQAQVRQALLATLQHTVQSRQVLAVISGVLGAIEDLRYRIVRQRIQPQLLDLLELFGVGEGGVVLVVVVQPEQGEDLVDRLNPGFRGRLALAPSLPRRCR